jgi:hypothetical protein
VSLEVFGAIVLLSMAAASHILQDSVIRQQSPLAMFSAIAKWIHGVNESIATRTNISSRRILQVEIVGVPAFGFTMIQIGEYAAAFATWLFLTIVVVAKICNWQNISAYLRGLLVFLAIIGGIVLITITNLKRDDEPWSNLQKLGAVVNTAFPATVEAGVIRSSSDTVTGLWLMESTTKCLLVPIDEFLFIRATNATPSPRTIVRYQVDSRSDWSWTWRTLTRIDLRDGYTVETIQPNPNNPHRTGGTMNIPGVFRIGFVPSSLDYKNSAVMIFDLFDLTIGGRVLPSQATATGWTAFKYAGFSRGTLRITIEDNTGKTYSSVTAFPNATLPENVTPHIIGVQGYVDTSACEIYK